MKFDKSKIYTAVNADEVKVGSKGYFADNLTDLKALVADESADRFNEILHINPSDNNYRFSFSAGNNYALFYLVEEPETTPKEVTAAEWDNRPRFMKVWNNCYEDAYNMLVVHIRSAEHSHPIVAVDCENEDICCFKHCTEIVLEKTEPEIEEAAADKKRYRPYKNSDEMIEDFKKRYNSYGGWSGKNNPMYCPLIWIVHKTTRNKSLIASYPDRNVQIASGFSNLESLFKGFTYLDGTPVGIKE